MSNHFNPLTVSVLIVTSNRSDRRVGAGRETVRAYTWDAVVDRYAALYDQGTTGR